MSKRQIVRVKPRAFDCDWKADLLAAGVKIPKKYSVLRYTPVNHDPMPFSVEIDETGQTDHRGDAQRDLPGTYLFLG